jgi:hypothetical protein
LYAVCSFLEIRCCTLSKISTSVALSRSCESVGPHTLTRSSFGWKKRFIASPLAPIPAGIPFDLGIVDEFVD